MMKRAKINEVLEQFKVSPDFHLPIIKLSIKQKKKEETNFNLI